MYYISDIKKYLRCQKLFQYHKYSPLEEYNVYLRQDDEISLLAAKKLNIENYYLGKKNDEMQIAISELNKDKWVIKGRFEYDRIRIKVPFIRKYKEGYEVVFLQLSNFPKKDDLLYYYYILWVLKNNNINVIKCRIIHLNSKYKRGKELLPDELFKITNHFYDKNNRKKDNISKVLKLPKNFNPLLDELDLIKKDTEIKIKKSKKCKNKVKCPYYDNCFSEENNKPVDHIDYLTGYKDTKKLEEFTSMKSINIETYNGKRNQIAQIKACQNEGLYFDKEEVEAWKKRFNKKPIYFIDFEWETYVIPPYEGLKTFDVLAFQYSIHILNEDDSVTHLEFLEKGDCRESFIKSLIRDIPKDVTIFSFNADGAEKLRIKQLIEQFPKYQKELEIIKNQIFDISTIFINGHIYHQDMKGAYSLKAISKALCELRYDDLDIKNGIDAVKMFRIYEETNDNKIKEDLLKYCSLDTLTMVEIYKYIVNL